MSQSRPANLIIELLGACFERTDVATVIRASHVSGHWRAAARSSPVFWRTIRLAAFSIPALELFVDRLDSSQTMGIAVCVDFLGPSIEICSEYVMRTVTHALLCHLHRIEILALHLRFNNLQELLARLTLPAPLLQSLELEAHPRTGDALRLPLELFVGAVPRLVHLKLRNIAIPLKAVPPWFQQLKTVSLIVEVGVIVSVPQTIVERFPCATSIHLYLARSSKISPDQSFTTPVRAHKRLEHVAIYRDYAPPALIQWCAGVRHLEWAEATLRQAQESLRQLQPGEFEMALRLRTIIERIPRWPDLLGVEFRGNLVLGGMAGTRSFSATLEMFGLNRSSYIVDTIQLARISSLELTHSLLAADRVGLLKTLPCCRNLRVILDVWQSNGRFDENMGGTAMVFVPALEQVQIAARLQHLSAPDPQQLRTFLIRFIANEEGGGGDGPRWGETLRVSLSGFTRLLDYSELQDEFVVTAEEHTAG